MSNWVTNIGLLTEAVKDVIYTANCQVLNFPQPASFMGSISQPWDSVIIKIKL
jgi:hypothetical protein